MDKATLTLMWDQMRQKYGIYLRLLEAIPADKYRETPIPGWRSAADLVSHVSGTIIREIAQGIAKGEITADESAEGGEAAGWKSGKDAVAFARKCWAEADAAVKTIGDAQLNATVPTPWGMSFPGHVGFHIMNDEFVHHRGQLYAYAKLFGAQPPFMWGYADNEPGFKPAS